MIVTGIQPTGSIHLGNLLGAVYPLIGLQKPAVGSVVFLADYHAITAGHNATSLRQNTTSLAAMLLASGLDDKTILFRQSAVPAHTELQWILAATATRMGWLMRMTAYREKSSPFYEQNGCTPYEHLLSRLDEIGNASWPDIAKHPTHPGLEKGIARIQEMARRTVEEVLVGANAEGPSLGLFAYPVLQAADILLYQADEVPVGDDQSQHLNLTVDIAQKFNREFGQIFTVPKAVYSTSAKRIMSLTEPTKKMSKSDPNEASRIDLTDNPDTIAKKIKRATTDADLISRFDLDSRPGLKNLLTIYAAFRNETLGQALDQFDGKGFGILKPAVVEAVVEGLRPIQLRYHDLMRDEQHIEAILANGAEQARALANDTMSAVRVAIGVE